MQDSGQAFDIPILFIIFNRLDTAERVFAEIKKQQPKRLYIAADGPRANKPGEAEKCQKVRDLAKQVDWDCELKTLFREKNYGCGRAVSGAISWFFENEEMGIILEDDCLPHPDFFPYCRELLIKYKDDDRIGIVSGDNLQFGIKYGDASYYFSAYANIWGWASWRRTWQGYDLYLKDYQLAEFKKNIEMYFSSWCERQVWRNKFLVMKKQGNNTWDYQFSFYNWRHHRLNIVPNTNLISNIGFNADSTHTGSVADPNSNLPTAAIMPLTHPVDFVQNKVADKFVYNHSYKKNILQLVWREFLYLFRTKPTFSEDK